MLIRGMAGLAMPRFSCGDISAIQAADRKSVLCLQTGRDTVFSPDGRQLPDSGPGKYKKHSSRICFHSEYARGENIFDLFGL